LLVETNIIYKYRAFGAYPDHDRTITTAPVDLDLTDLLTTHAIGETITWKLTTLSSSGRSRQATRSSIAGPS
jgi:hypothetical protein